MQTKFSANLGLLWRELPFVERIHRAGNFGFRAVEFHDQAQESDLDEVQAALNQHDLQVISLNSQMGETFGKAARPADEIAARHEIKAAIQMADYLDAGAVHVLAGCTQDDAANDVFSSNLVYALDNTDKVILIEPISNIGGYFLNSLPQAVEILKSVSHPRLKIMFDCFHIRHEYEDIGEQFERHQLDIGHVQIASFPDRQEPFDGAVNYSRLLPAIVEVGYDGWFGCEYVPQTSVESGISWMESYP